MSGVVSITDYIVEQMHGAAALARIRSDPALYRELEIRRELIEELRGWAGDRVRVDWGESDRAAAAVRPQPAPAKRGAPSPAKRSVVLREDLPARFEIRLGDYGVDQIRREFSWARQQGVETGGYLWSHYENRDDEALVAYVSDPASYSRHSNGSVKLGDPYDVRRELPDWLPRSELELAGDWHLHPSSDARPSKTDLDTWAARLRTSGGRAYASVIVTPGFKVIAAEPELSLAAAVKAVCERTPSRMMTKYNTSVVPVTDNIATSLRREGKSFDCAFDAANPGFVDARNFHLVVVRRAGRCKFTVDTEIYWPNDINRPYGYPVPDNETYAETCRSLRR